MKFILIFPYIGNSRQNVTSSLPTSSIPNIADESPHAKRLKCDNVSKPSHTNSYSTEVCQNTVQGKNPRARKNLARTKAKEVPSQSQLTSITSSVKRPSIDCDLCPATFPDQGELGVHYLCEHEESQLEMEMNCLICGKIFVERSQILNHIIKKGPCFQSKFAPFFNCNLKLDYSNLLLRTITCLRNASFSVV